MSENSVLQLLQDYGYLIIFVWAFLEGEMPLILAGVLTQRGLLDLNPNDVALFAFLGSFTSDQLMFFLGKWKGRDILQRFPRAYRKTATVRELFKRHQMVLILSFRFLYGLRNFSAIFLGISGVHHAKFFFLNMIGALIWAFTFSYIGYYFGLALEGLISRFPHLEEWILTGAVFVIICVALVVKLVFRYKEKKNTSAM